MLPVALLAGGLATRLHPMTETIPKALIEVGGLPFICHQLDYLFGQGIRQVVVCIGYLGEKIQSVVSDGSQFGLNVTYSPDGPTLLGTGGALKQALPLLGEQFFVLYGDSFLPVDFLAVEKAFFNCKKNALMTILENCNRWDKSNVLFRDGELREYNKDAPLPEMTYIDYGLGVLSKSTLKNYGIGQHFDLSEVYNKLSRKGQLVGFEVHERFYEIGSRSGLKETENYFLQRGET